jgi:hypothetical protein
MQVAAIRNSTPSNPAMAPRDDRYARCIATSKRVRWDIDADVIRGRVFDPGKKFLPDALSLVHELEFLDASEQRFLSQVQGRTYANIFGLIERSVNAKVLELSQSHVLGDQVALEALVRFSDEELKHQELFRRIELLAGADMPCGYQQVGDPNDVAKLVMGKSTWAVLALICDIELITQQHYRDSIHDSDDSSELYRDVFLFHWKEESQHAILDELEWRREDARIGKLERDAAVIDLIALVGAVDALLQAQAATDADYFLANTERDLLPAERKRVRAQFLKAYRWQHIVTGVQNPRFIAILAELTDAQQRARINEALVPLVAAVTEGR